MLFQARVEDRYPFQRRGVIVLEPAASAASFPEVMRQVEKRRRGDGDEESKINSCAVCTARGS